MSGLLVAPITLQIFGPTAFSDSAEGADIASLRQIGEHLRDLATERNVPLKQVDPSNEYKASMHDHFRTLMAGSSADSLLAIGPRSVSEQATSSRTCTLCTDSLSDPQAALNHTAYHILCSPDMMRSISTPDPCPLCLGSQGIRRQSPATHLLQRLGSCQHFTAPRAWSAFRGGSHVEQLCGCAYDKSPYRLSEVPSRAD